MSRVYLLVVALLGALVLAAGNAQASLRLAVIHLRHTTQSEASGRCLALYRVRVPDSQVGAQTLAWKNDTYRTWRGRLYHVRHTASRCAPTVAWYISRQIYVATLIGRNASIDPWPNCPDPIWDGASSWQATVNCENSGNWLDSPGYFRCGLQFDPMWERVYGRLCP